MDEPGVELPTYLPYGTTLIRNMDRRTLGGSAALEEEVIHRAQV
jgi:hypothetical protein